MPGAYSYVRTCTVRMHVRTHITHVRTHVRTVHAHVRIVHTHVHIYNTYVLTHMDMHVRTQASLYFFNQKLRKKIKRMFPSFDFGTIK